MGQESPTPEREIIARGHANKEGNFETPELGWDLKKEEVDAYTGREVPPLEEKPAENLEETPAERERLNKEIRATYTAHHPEKDDSERRAA